MKKSWPGAGGQAVWAKLQGRKMRASASRRNPLLQPAQSRASFSRPHPLPPEHSMLGEETPGRDHWAWLGEMSTSVPGLCAQPLTCTRAWLPVVPTASPETPQHGSSTPDLPLSNVSRLPAQSQGETGWRAGLLVLSHSSSLASYTLSIGPGPVILPLVWVPTTTNK